jgi:chromosome segregation ATPase
LKAENFELKQQERDYGLLNSQLLDLDYRFKALQEEKFKIERDGKERRDVLQNKGLVLQDEIQRLSETVKDRQNRLKDTELEVTTYKNLLMDKDVELSKLKQELRNSNEENIHHAKDRQVLESELDVLIDDRRRAEMDLIRLKEVNENSMKGLDIIIVKERDTDIDVDNARRKLINLENEFAIIQKDQSQSLASLDLARDKQRATQVDLNRLLEINEKLKNENGGLVVRIGGLEREFGVLRQRLDDTSVILSTKEKELLGARSELVHTEDRSAEIASELVQTHKENDTLKVVADKYRNDAEVQKRFRDEEARQKLMLEEEKKRLEKKAIDKEIEARNVKKELEQIHLTSERLLENHDQLNNELEALRQHADLLESHNMNVRTTINYIAT